MESELDFNTNTQKYIVLFPKALMLLFYIEK